jgi:hypothetical protein
MLARCQFGIDVHGAAGATMTYPIPGYPWRRNTIRSYRFEISDELKEQLFLEPSRVLAEHPAECLSADQAWADSSEQANSVTRDRKSNTLCYTIGICRRAAEPEVYFSIREDSVALRKSLLYKTVAELIAPYETL